MISRCLFIRSVYVHFKETTNKLREPVAAFGNAQKRNGGHGGVGCSSGMAAQTPFPYFRLGYALDFLSTASLTSTTLFPGARYPPPRRDAGEASEWGWKAIELPWWVHLDIVHGRRYSRVWSIVPRPVNTEEPFLRIRCVLRIVFLRLTFKRYRHEEYIANLFMNF